MVNAWAHTLQAVPEEPDRPLVILVGVVEYEAHVDLGKVIVWI